MNRNRYQASVALLFLLAAPAIANPTAVAASQRRDQTRNPAQFVRGRAGAQSRYQGSGRCTARRGCPHHLRPGARRSDGQLFRCGGDRGHAHGLPASHRVQPGRILARPAEQARGAIAQASFAEYRAANMHAAYKPGLSRAPFPARSRVWPRHVTSNT